MYNFSRLINKYSRAYNIVHREVIGTTINYELGGEIEEEIQETEITGAIVSSRKPVRYDNGGFGYESVTHLYCYHKLKDEDVVEVQHRKDDKKQQYQVFLAKDYSLFDTSQGEGLYIYELRGVVR